MDRYGSSRFAADRLDNLPPASALAEIREVHRFLVDELLPHEKAEEESFYPRVASLLGGADPTGTMVRAHAEIMHLTRVLGGLLEELGPDGPTEEDLPELRRVLYGLYAILVLHFAQKRRRTCRLSRCRRWRQDGDPHVGRIGKKSRKATCQ